jgi:hypothetical protein
MYKKNQFLVVISFKKTPIFLKFVRERQDDVEASFPACQHLVLILRMPNKVAAFAPRALSSRAVASSTTTRGWCVGLYMNCFSSSPKCMYLQYIHRPHIHTRNEMNAHTYYSVQLLCRNILDTNFISSDGKRGPLGLAGEGQSRGSGRHERCCVRRRGG